MSERWVEIEDYRKGAGWANVEQRAARGREYCKLLESGEILFFREPPFELPFDHRKFLVDQEWAELRMHKNVSYRPRKDALKGFAASGETIKRLRSIFRNYSAAVIDFVATFLSPYAGKCTADFASFRPFEEQRRELPLHKRNDLLHVDAFPSRPTRGGRILRVFTNLNPGKPRIWNTTENFEVLARKYAEDAGLRRIAHQSWISRSMHDWGGKLGLRGMGRTPYDTFMLGFHDYLKEDADFQKGCPKVRLEFPPLATWLVFTDGVAHAAISGQYALEQTFLVPPVALVAPEQAPYRILERIAGQPLVS